MNTVTIVGNLTDDPELKYTSNGNALANFTVAVNRRRKNGDQWEDQLDGFFRCTVWRDAADNVAESLHKGQRVIVTGRLEQRSWETEDGSRRSVVELQVDEIGPSLRWARATVEKAQRSDRTQAPPSGRDWTPGPDPQSRRELQAEQARVSQQVAPGGDW